MRGEADEKETFYVRDASGQVLSEYQRKLGGADPPVWNKDYLYLFGKSFALVKNQTPAPPKRPWATNVSPGHVKVNWDPVDEPDILGYALERRYWSSPTAGESKITYSLAAAARSFTDTTSTTVGAHVIYTVWSTNSPDARSGA